MKKVRDVCDVSMKKNLDQMVVIKSHLCYRVSETDEEDFRALVLIPDVFTHHLFHMFAVVTPLTSAMLFMLDSINTFLMCHYHRTHWPVLPSKTMSILTSHSVSFSALITRTW